MSMRSVAIDPGFYFFEILSPSYSIQGPQFGAEIEQVLYKRLSTSLSFYFAKRRVQAGVFNIIPFDGFKFNHLRGNVSLNYKLTNYFSFGLGYDYNQMRELKYTLREETSSRTFKSLLVDHGLHVNVRGFWKNIELKGYFHRGLNDNLSDSAHELSIRPVNYFGFSLGYRMKIINSFNKGKKTECPTF